MGSGWKRKLLILALGLAFIIPLGVGVWMGYQDDLDRSQRNWYWDSEFQGSQLVKHFPGLIDYTYPTMMESDRDRSFRYYVQSSYSQTVRSYDGGPITITADDNLFGAPSAPEEYDQFTFTDLYDSFSYWFTDWHPLDWLSERLSFLGPTGTAAAVDRFAVFGDAECTLADITVDDDCWSTTSGGNGDGAPVGGDGLIFDSGDTTSDALGGNLDVTTGTIDFCSGVGAPDAACAGAWTGGVLTIDGAFTLTNTGTFNLNGGTITVSATGGIDSGAFTLNGGVLTSISTAAALSHDGLTITSGTFAKGTATLTVTGALTMDGGDLTSTSGAATVSGATNISNTASAIDFGSETWTFSDDFDCVSTDTTVWEAGSGTVTFDDADGDASFTPCAITAEAHFSSVTFDSTVSSQTWTMATNALQWSGTLTVADATLATTDLGLSTGALVIGTAGILTADASVVAVTSVTMTGGTSGVLTLTTGTWTVSGTWDTSGSSSTFNEGTSSVILAATGDLRMTGTMAFYDLIVNLGATATAFPSILRVRTATVNGTLTGGATDLRMTFGSTVTDPLTLGVSGDVSGLDGVQFLGNEVATWTVTLPSETYNYMDLQSVTGALGTITFQMDGAVTVGEFYLSFIAGALGTLDTATFDFTSTNSTYTYADGSILWSSGTHSIGGTADVVILAGGYWDLGSSTITITAPTYTNSTTNASWVAGSGTVVFSSATGGTLTFAGVNLSEPEFFNIAFDSTGTTQTFTMATRALRWSGTLTISDASSTTTLATADLSLSTAALVVGNGGILTANASTVVVTSVTMTGGTTGVITVTTGAWTVSGNWDTSGASSTYTQGTGIVTFDATATITMLSTDIVFDDLSITGGTATMASAVTVTNTLTLTATLATADLALTATALVVGTAGVLTANASTVVVTTVTMTGGVSGVITLTSGSWTVSGSWDTSGASSTFTQGASSTVDFAATATITMLTADDDFFNLTISAGTATAASSIDVLGAMIISGGTFAKGTQTLDVTGTLTMSGGDFTSTSGDVNLAAVTISSAASSIDFGSEAWTVSGNWSNASTDVSWDAGTGSITFDAAGAQTIGGAGTMNLFYDVVLTGGAKAFTASFTTNDFSSTGTTRTMTITDTVTWTIAGATTVAGASSAVLTIVSSSPDTQWTWTVSSGGQVVITYADIQDAAATSVTAATAARFDATAATNTDSENNTYVEFAGSPVTEYVGVRWYEDTNSYYWAGTVDSATSLTQWDVATDTGYFGTTVVTAGVIPTFTICSSDAAAAVTFTIGGLTFTNRLYVLTRDGNTVATATSTDASIWTATVTAGWNTSCATNSMVLTASSVSGGGGDDPDLPDDPEVDGPGFFEGLFENVSNFLADAAMWIAVVILALAALLWISYAMGHRPRRAIMALIATVAGIVVYLLSKAFTIPEIVTSFKAGIVVLALGLWVGFFMIRVPKIGFYAALLSVVGFLVWFLL